MKKYVLIIEILIGALAIAAIVFVIVKNHKSTNPTANNTANVISNTASNNTTPTVAPTQPAVTPPPQISPYGLAYPIADFKARITKKPFGIYITPKTSPVQPERFTGYHTGTDVEYTDITADVPVYALADGKIVLSRTASGYGGVIMLEFDLNGVKHTALYGHIRPSSLPAVGLAVTKGQQLAVLGTGYSAETDGERRHLHFAILSNNRLDLAGYVSTNSALSGWLDPLSLYN
jgi:murein DD-endopeptidase MepM/ murein hydrolase activator NlpD